MSNNLINFADLIQQTKVRIPKIQRDYAQGRICRNVDGIRKDFIHVLMSVVKGKREKTELDFIYGSNKDNAFEPLDGQQRLTTLFLLHWIFGINLKTKDGKHSVFTYETRNTSQEFCDELVQHSAKKLIKEANEKTKAEKEKNERLKSIKSKENTEAAAEQDNTDKLNIIVEQTKDDMLTSKKKEKEANVHAELAQIKSDQKPKKINPSDIIRSRDWFKFEWRSDPTILSMLVVIDAIYDEIENDWNKILDEYQKNLSKITFNMLNLKDFGLSNELFIKMNARGKQLSDFDKLKSTLEEELQIQQKEKREDGLPIATSTDEQKWRTLMDGAWIDFFWHKYARSVIISTEQFEHENREQRRLEAAKNAEKQFKKLILRLIALQFFENSSSCETLLNAAYNIDEDSIDDLIGVYNDSLTEIRSDDQYQINPKTQILIDFPKLITDINNLIYLDKNGIYAEVSGLLSENSHIDKNETTLFESFLAAKVPNDVVLVFYAMLLFLRFYPIQKSENITRVDDISQYAKWIKNLQDWVLAMRNVLLNDNNNQRIDKLFSSFEATQSLKQVLDDLNSFIKDKSLNIYDDDTVILQFFGASNKTYKRLDNQSLDEERKKARLKLDDPTWWTKSIEKVETHTYLWGQIRCLLLWAQNSKHSFEDYGQRLVSLLEAISVSGSKFYAALLAYSPHCWSKTNRLFQYNKDRDNSFKRCLRDSDGQILFKSLIDNWRENYAAKAASDYLNSLIDNGKTAEDIEPWVKCILRYPDIIDYASYKRLFIINGHVVLAQRKTPDSHCIDPIFRFFSILCENKKDPNVQYEIFDSKGAYTHAFEFITHEGIKYLVQWDGSAGEYSIKINDNNPEVHSAQETVAMMEHIIVE